MSERVRDSALTSLLASKRFVVSLCAAIAMVLGAMSAGASVFSEAPLAESQAANVVLSDQTSHASGSPLTTEASLFTSKKTLASRTIAVQQPLYTAAPAAPVSKEKKVLNLTKLNQDSIKSTSAALFFDPTPTAPAKSDAAIVATPPATDTTTPAVPEELAPPTTTPTTEQPPAPAEQPAEQSPTSDPTTEPSMNIMSTTETNPPTPDGQQLKN